ncbi:MAG: sugar ABC transporter permease, partial [Actinomycetes bacterium]
MTAPVIDTQSGERALNPVPAPRKRGSFSVHFAHYKWLYLLLLPGVVYFAIFRYGPMYGVTIAFKDYVPFLGVNGSP